MTFSKSRTRLAAIMALGVAAAAAIPATAFAAPAADGCLVFNDQTGTVTGFNTLGSDDAPCSLDLTIPSAIGGVPVVAIGDHAFSGITLDSIVIPDSVKTIDPYAFANTGADSVAIGAGVKTIGESAFAGNDLTSVTVPASVSSLGESAFAHNPVRSVSLDGDNLDIPGSTFLATDDLSITDVTIGSGIRAIGQNLFSAQPVSKLTIAEGPTSIAAYAFNGNRLTSVAVPSSVQSVGEKAFSNGLIRTATFGAGVQSVADSAFELNHLESLTFEGNTTFTSGLFFQNFTAEEIQSAMTSAATPGEGIDKLRASATVVKVYSTNADLVATHGDGAVFDLGAGTFPFGYVINPAAYTVASDSADGASVADDVRHTGIGLTDYRALPAVAAGVASFYQLGDTIEVTPVAIPGYTTPAASTVQLSDAENGVTFEYVADGTAGTPGQGSDDETPAAGDSDSGAPASGENNAAPGTSDSALVPTGGFDSTPLYVGSGIAMLLGAGILLVTRLRRRSLASE